MQQVIILFSRHTLSRDVMATRRRTCPPKLAERRRKRQINPAFRLRRAPDFASLHKWVKVKFATANGDVYANLTCARDVPTDSGDHCGGRAHKWRSPIEPRSLS